MEELIMDDTMPKEIVFERKANYYETDQMGVVHHSNYIRWFEEARLYFMDMIGLPCEWMEDAGIYVPVLGVSCDYKQSVRFAETVCIHVHVTEFNGIRLKCSYEIYNKETGVLCTTGTTDHCFLTKTYKPLSLKKSFPEFYEIFMRALNN